MQTKTKNKFLAALLAVVMLFVGFFTLNGGKTVRAKAYGDYTYSGQYIPNIIPNFVDNALGDFGTVPEWILLDKQLIDTSPFYSYLVEKICDMWGLDVEGPSMQDAIANSGIHIVRYEPEGSYFSDITRNGTYTVFELLAKLFENNPLNLSICAMGIWCFEGALVADLEIIQEELLASDLNYLMPVYIIEREQVIPGESDLMLWVYHDARGGGFWYSWLGRDAEDY
ncbi:MAG: hypothetical protein IJX88_02345 [Clostridia bacterium]|nr:hypothetical protein [Clostridia bacterium]